MPSRSCLFALLVLLAGSEFARAETVTKADALAFLRGGIRFEGVLFDGAAFPKASFFPPGSAIGFLGPYEISTHFFDRLHREVETAEEPGPYGAVVELRPKSGLPVRRLITLFRTAKAMKMGRTFAAMDAKEQADWTGLPVETLERSAAPVAKICGNRSVFALSRDAAVARLFAGLALLPAGADESSRTNADPLADERQWWVDQKRRLLDLGPVYAPPVIVPRHYHGRPQMTVQRGSAEAAGMKPDAAEKIDRVLQEWAAESKEPFSVCIVHRGVIVLHQAYGEKEGRPMKVSNPCWMSSITKTLSATLMMMLVENGQVSLDDPVSKFLPQLRDRRDGPPLTLRHLYTHTSGLGDWPLWDGEAPDYEDQVADILPLLEVGKKWDYNAQGYMLGGKVIEAVSGEALPRFYRRHLLEPLGCEHTDVVGAHNDAQSIPLDMARIAQMLLNGGVYGDLEFFSSKTFEQMLPQRLTAVLGPDTTREGGIGLDRSTGSDEIGHPAASGALFIIDRKEQLIVVMCRDKKGPFYSKYRDRFLDTVREGIDRGKP